ncbi:MAG: glycosyltransferase family 4 protein [Acidobacteriota bacterium]|nr:glycosyltransferase family 4 protein [Acidobacteriota bacterium]
MRITFLMPCYMWVPSGGFRIVYEYANRLTTRGHEVTVVHPRWLRKCYFEHRTLRGWAGTFRRFGRELFWTPSIDWQHVDERVQLLFVPSSDPRYIPDGEVLFATAWHTVHSVLECSPSKGRKFYLIQGYETFLGPKELVDATWRAPLHKVVIAKWLLEVGKVLGAQDMAHISNAIDHERFRLIRPIAGRPRQVSMMFSTTPLKGSADGIEAVRIARNRFPDLRVVFFGTSQRPAWIPEWVDYHRNPAQDFLVSEIYNRSSIFLSPSWTEGFGLTPAEAAACGCAIVTTDSGGVRDFISHGVTGLLSPARDPRSLAENLCNLLEDETSRVRLAEAGNVFIRQFTWERNTTLLENVISQGLGIGVGGRSEGKRRAAESFAVEPTR